MARQTGDRDRDEHGRSGEIGADQQSPSIPPIRGEAAVQAEDERGDAVGESDRDDAERPARIEREPHQRDVVQRVAELARGDGEIHVPEFVPPEQLECASGTRRRRPQLVRDRGHGIGHAMILP